jgi:flavin-binding protein dodecin
VVGCSTESYEDAINNAIVEARKSLSGLMWFEVTEFRGAITDTGTEFQATVKLGFRLKD